MNTVLESVGTTRYETQATEVSQLSLDAAWLLITLKQRTQKEGNIREGIIGAPAMCKLWIDVPNGVNMREAVTVLRILKKAAVNRCFD